MKKRILSLALAVLMTLLLASTLAIPAFAREDYNGRWVDEWIGDFDVFYNLSINDGRLGLNAYRGSGGNIVIPDGVEYMSSKVFKDNTDIISVVIPNSVTEIKSEVFNGCTNLTSVTYSQ